MLSEFHLRIISEAFNTYFEKNIFSIDVTEAPDEDSLKDVIKLDEKHKIFFLNFMHFRQYIGGLTIQGKNVGRIFDEVFLSKDAWELIKFFKGLLNDFDKFKDGYEFRFFNVQELTNLMNINSNLKDRAITIRGTIFDRYMQIESYPKTQIWRCLSCDYLNRVSLTTRKKQSRWKGSCKRREEGVYICLKRTHTFVEDTDMENTFRIQIESLPEDTPHKQDISTATLELSNNLCNQKFIDDLLMGKAFEFDVIVKLEPVNQKDSSGYVTYLEIMSFKHTEKKEEIIVVSKDEEQKIKTFLADRNSINQLTDMFGTRVIGFKREKKFFLILKVLQEHYKKRKGNKKPKDFLCHQLLIGDYGCVSGDTRIVRFNGKMVKIKDLGTKHLQKIDVSLFINRTNSKNPRFAKATKFHHYKNAPTLIITTKSGKEIQVTHNHPLKTCYGWVRADKLKEGDKLHVIRKIPCTLKKNIKLSTTPVRQKSFNLPKTSYNLDEDLAMISGYIQGDGWFRTAENKRKYSLGWVINEEEMDIKPIFDYIIFKKFHYNVKERKKKSTQNLIDGRITYGKQILSYNHIYSKEIVELLSFLRKKTEVPDEFFNSKNSVVANYIKGLFESDGTVINYFDKKRKDYHPKIVFAQHIKNKRMIQDLQLLFLRFGIRAFIQNNLTINQITLTICKSKDILLFSKHIGFISFKKKQKLQNIVNIAKKINKTNQRKNKFYEKITSIKDGGKIDVYDIHVPEHNRFIGNGIVNHNTGKSEFAEICQEICQNSDYIIGSSTSSVGLTGITERNAQTGHFSISAGKLVRTSGDTLIIEEFDKQKNNKEFGIINQAMSKFEYSITKGGKDRKFKCDTTIMVIANPIKKKFDESFGLLNQIDIQGDLLSRFDIISFIKESDNIDYQKKINEVMIKRRDESLLVKDKHNAEFIKRCIKVASETMINIESQNLLNHLNQYTEYMAVVRRNMNIDDKEIFDYINNPRNRASRIKIIFGVALFHGHEEPTEEDIKEGSELFYEFQKDFMSNSELLNPEEIITSKTPKEMEEMIKEKVSNEEIKIDFDVKKDTKLGKIDLLIQKIGEGITHAELERWAMEELELSVMEIDKHIELFKTNGEIYENPRGTYRQLK